MSGEAVLVRSATLVPMTGDPDGDQPLGTIEVADLRVRGDTIVEIGTDLAPQAGEVTFDASGMHLLPGFVQGHVHFCQTLFRGLADDLELMDWLRARIWPLEAAHDPESLRTSAELSIAELVLGGTTTAQVMESVHHTEHSFAAAARSGMTVVMGNCLMDLGGDGVPAALPSADAGSAMRAVESLCRDWHGVGRIRYAVSPRFVLSCSEGLLRDAAAFAAQENLRLHTHAAEHPGEVREVEAAFGCSYLEALERLDQLGPRTGLAHCVHTTADDRARLVAHDSSVLHCPSTNLKLGSGIAPIADYAARGIPVALGADGAPCNNRFSAQTEMRQAALLQALAAGPGTWPARRALVAATSGAARALGLDDVGSLRVGARADLVLLQLGDRYDGPGPGEDPIARLVWAPTDRDVRHVMVGGRWAVRDGALDSDVLGFDPAELTIRGRAQRALIATRAGIAR